MSEEKPEPQKWIERIKRTEKINKPKRDETIRFKKAYMGDFTNKRGEETSKYTVRINLIYYFVETILASVFGGDPRVRGKYRKDPNRQLSANLYAYNTNYWLKELDTKAELRDAVFDAFFGPAAIYTSWTFETDESGKVLKDEPIVRWLNFWEDLRVDPDVLRTRRARWMAVRVTVPHEEFLEIQNIKEEYRFGDKAIKPTQRPEDIAEDNVYKQDKNYNPSDAEWVSYWEVWDKQRMERKLVHESCPDSFLNEDLSWPFWLEPRNDLFPVTILHAKQDPFGPMSFSEFRPSEDQIWERVRLRSVQGAIARRSAPKYLYQKGAGTQQQLKKLLTSDIMSANELNDVGKFGLMPVPDIPDSFYKWDTQLSEDFGNTSGLAEFENNRLANTATEASIAEGRSTVRKSERTNKIEEFVVTVATKLGMLCQQLQNRAVTFAIDPEDLLEGEREVFAVTKEEIQGEFDLELVPGTMEWQNTESLKRDTLKFLEIAAQSGEANVPYLLSQIADLLDLNPKLALLTPEQKAEMAAAQKEPAVEFDKVKMEFLSPADRLRVIERAKEEAGVKSLTPGPRLAAGAAIQQIPNTALPDNASFNKAGNPEPNAPVAPASLTSDR